MTEAEIKLPGVTLNRETFEVRIDAEVCLTTGILEYVVCRPNTFEHEAIFTTEAKPELVHAALLLAGLEPTPQVRGLADIWWEKALKNPLSRVMIEVTWEEEGKEKRATLNSLMQGRDDQPDDANPGKKVEEAWVFAGSFMDTNRETGKRFYAANASGILVGIWPDPSTVIQYGIASGNPYEAKDLGMAINEELVPPVGTKVELVFSRLAPSGDTSPGEK